MATLTVSPITRDGLVVSLAAADVAGDEFANTGKEFLVVDNQSGGNCTVTLDIQRTVDGQAIIDRSVVLADGERRYIGPFKTNFYNDGDGNMNVSYSTVTSVTVAAIQLTPV